MKITDGDGDDGGIGDSGNYSLYWGLKILGSVCMGAFKCPSNVTFIDGDNFTCAPRFGWLFSGVSLRGHCRLYHN